MSDSVFDLALPKWPQMFVTGVSVTAEQAQDIIFRTDDFLTSACEYSGGNERVFNENYRRSAGLCNDATDSWALAEYVREKIGYVETQYVSNNWASSAFVYGPHGWCSPAGTIFYEDNVGKWPNIKDIYDDWVELATAFPFLDLSATLYDGESCEYDTQPVVTFYVKAGKVSAAKPIDPRSDPLIIRHERNPDIFRESRELGLPIDWYEVFAKKVKIYADEFIALQR